MADPTISGATADPYGSGIPNLLAYALELNPATARPQDVPNAVASGGHLSITYFWPNATPDITFVVEVSTDLQTWNTGSGYIQQTANVASATGHTITIQDTLPATTGRRFMRLRVTQIP